MDFDKLDNEQRAQMRALTAAKDWSAVLDLFNSSGAARPRLKPCCQKKMAADWAVYGLKQGYFDEIQTSENENRKGND